MIYGFYSTQLSEYSFNKKISLFFCLCEKKLYLLTIIPEMSEMKKNKNNQRWAPRFPMFSTD